jgi:signal transduction histidine kinase
MDEVVERIDALNGLLQDLMLFARPRAARRTQTSLLRVAQEAIAMLREDPAGSGVETTVEGDEVIALADGEMVRATVFNLLLNAAQAMDGRGRIRVTVDADADTSTIAVRDSGPGIPPDVRAQVFEPFFTTKSRGGGLGLAIARRSAEMHDGSLTLDCPADGGTVATLVLRLSPADADRP